MKWVRCLVCRTVYDIDRYAVCDGCNGALLGQSAPYHRDLPAARLEAQRDDKRSWAALVILGVLAATAMGFLLFVPIKGGYEGDHTDRLFTAAFLAAPLLAGFVHVAASRKDRDPANAGTTFVGGAASAVLALIGAGILVFVVCAGRIIASID